MDRLRVITAILTLISGIGIFLIACTVLSSNLESLSGNKLKVLFQKASKNRLFGVGIGALGTAAIQSSGATTVMVIGFVNAGIMSLTQAAAMIFGANVGTTITGQIVALGMFSNNMISTTLIFSAFAGIGAFMTSFSKKDIFKKAGGILSGFGMLFVGLSIMSGSMESFAELEKVRLFLAGINNSVLLVIIGAVFTAIIQSSSVMTSVAITMLVSGLISLNQGIYIIMGSNIGSCAVAVIAGFTGGQSAKRTALIHLIFNISGVIVFMLIGFLLDVLTGGKYNFGIIFSRSFPDAPQTQLAMFHTAFNLLTVILVLPFTDALVKLVTDLIPDKAEENEDNHGFRLYYLNEQMLITPALAVQQVKHEIINMADIALSNWNLALRIITKQDFSAVPEFELTEQKLDFINRELVKYIVKLSEKSLCEKDRVFLSTTYRSVSDLERVGDYAENVIEYAESLKNANDAFSDVALKEIDVLKNKIESLFEDIMKAYVKNDISFLASAEKTEDEIDRITNEMADNHIRRLSVGECTPNAGTQYLSLASNAERVADHFMNIGKKIYSYI